MENLKLKNQILTPEIAQEVGELIEILEYSLIQDSLDIEQRKRIRLLIDIIKNPPEYQPSTPWSEYMPGWIQKRHSSFLFPASDWNGKDFDITISEKIRNIHLQFLKLLWRNIISVEEEEDIRQLFNNLFKAQKNTRLELTPPKNIETLMRTQNYLSSIGLTEKYIKGRETKDLNFISRRATFEGEQDIYKPRKDADPFEFKNQAEFLIRKLLDFKVGKFDDNELNAYLESNSFKMISSAENSDLKKSLRAAIGQRVAALTGFEFDRNDPVAILKSITKPNLPELLNNLSLLLTPTITYAPILFKGSHISDFLILWINVMFRDELKEVQRLIDREGGGISVENSMEISPEIIIGDPDPTFTPSPIDLLNELNPEFEITSDQKLPIHLYYPSADQYSNLKDYSIESKNVSITTKSIQNLKIKLLLGEKDYPEKRFIDIPTPLGSKLIGLKVLNNMEEIPEEDYKIYETDSGTFVIELIRPMITYERISLDSSFTEHKEKEFNREIKISPEKSESLIKVLKALYLIPLNYTFSNLQEFLNEVQRYGIYRVENKKDKLPIHIPKADDEFPNPYYQELTNLAYGRDLLKRNSEEVQFFQDFLSSVFHLPETVSEDSIRKVLICQNSAEVALKIMKFIDPTENWIKANCMNKLNPNDNNGKECYGGRHQILINTDSGEFIDITPDLRKEDEEYLDYLQNIKQS